MEGRHFLIHPSKAAVQLQRCLRIMVPFANLRTALILITYLNCYDVQILGRRLLALSAITLAEKEEDSMADIQD